MKDIIEMQPEVEEEQGTVSGALMDLHEAYMILGQCRTLLHYVSDPILCKTVSERERLAMRRLIEHVVAFRASIKDFYASEGIF